MFEDFLSICSGRTRYDLVAVLILFVVTEHYCFLINNSDGVKIMNLTFNDFINKYDVSSSIILLEGKRDVNESDADKLIQLGRILAKESKSMIFKSGNAQKIVELYQN